MLSIWTSPQVGCAVQSKFPSDSRKLQNCCDLLQHSPTHNPVHVTSPYPWLQRSHAPSFLLGQLWSKCTQHCGDTVRDTSGNQSALRYLISPLHTLLKEINHLPEDKILTLSKLNDKFNVTQQLKFVIHGVENINGTRGT